MKKRSEFSWWCGFCGFRMVYSGTPKTRAEWAGGTEEMETIGMAYTVSEFCRQARISEGLYFKLQRQGQGPIVARVGRRVVITHSSAQAWMEQRERPSQQHVARISGVVATDVSRCMSACPKELKDHTTAAQCCDDINHSNEQQSNVNQS